MMDKIRDYVVTTGFGTQAYTTIGSGEVLLLSNGIKYALNQSYISYKALDNAIEKFLSRDFGTMYGYGEKVTAGNEYWEYQSELSDGNIYLHRERGAVVAYFLFER